MIAVYKKEMRTYFTNMMGYVFLTFMLLIIGLFFTLDNVFRLDPRFQMVLSNVTTFLFILIPVITMRLFSEEARQKTDQLLFTSPLSIAQIVLGKYFAAVSLFLVAVGISVFFPIFTSQYGSLPVNQITGTYIGFILLGMSCIAVGVFISVLTDNQIIAAVATVGMIFIMFVMEAIAFTMPTTTFASFMFVAIIIAVVIAVWFNATKNIIATFIVAVLALAVAGGLYLFNNLIFDGIIVRTLLWLSVFSRFTNFSMGILNPDDIIYYISFSALFIYLAINIIEKRRWR